MLLHPLRSAALLLLLLHGATGAASAAGSVSGGSTRLEIEAAIADSLGIDFSGAPAVLDGGADFPADAASTLGVDVEGDDVEGFTSGALLHDGALLLHVGGATVPLGGFGLVPGELPLDLELRDAVGTRWLDVRSPHVRVEDGQLVIREADLLIAPELAGLLGRPELSGAFLGRLDADWPLQTTASALGLSPGTTGGGGGPCDPDFVNPPDVALTALDSLSQRAREAGGRVAVAPSATLENVGVGSVEWFRAIAPDGPVGPHPFLALHFYRLADGVLEQIGRSDLKHAFFSVNTGCPCAGGQILYGGCSDVYGVNTNINRDYLAPRSELDIATRSWESLGSHFDGTPVDDFRSHGEAGHGDAYEHRLVVQETDLQVPGARYFIEAWYVVARDDVLLNSLGHREVAPSLSMGVWAFPAVDGLMQGSIVDELVDPAAPGPGQSTSLVDTGEGHLHLAADVTALGGGAHRYEYALMNFDLARRVRSISLPVASGASVSGAVYRDGDGDPANDWTATVDAAGVTFSAPAGAALDWGSLISLGFEADAPPTPAAAQLAADVAGPVLPGIDTLGPGVPDRDADGVPDEADVCPDWPDDQSDTNGDGRGDACECGDQSGDGSVDIGDILAINAAIFDQTLVTPLCDADHDGLCTVGDILAVNAKIFGAQTHCARSPAP